jgi:hypothetical protein
VKFGAFYEYLQQEHAGSFDRIASGHYAKVQRLQAAPAQQSEPAAAASGQQPVQQQHHAATSHSSSSGVDADSPAAALLERQASHAGASSSDSSSGGRSGSSSCRLLMVPDAVKDQTYFLANLSPSQLSRCMFPLGSFTKPQVSSSCQPPLHDGRAWFAVVVTWCTDDCNTWICCVQCVAWMCGHVKSRQLRMAAAGVGSRWCAWASQAHISAQYATPACLASASIS